jgi:hypothetical protein
MRAVPPRRRLRELEASYRKAVARAEERRLARNAAIVKAVTEGGLSQAEVARITQLGEARIGQIMRSNGTGGE